MELLLTAAAFTVWQCLAWLPRGAFVFVPWPWRRRPVPGGGVRAFHPWPGADCLLAAGLPFTPTDEGVRFEGRLGSRVTADAPREVGYDQLDAVTTRGAYLRLEGRPLQRCASPRHAAWNRSRLRDLAALPAEERSARLQQWLRASLDPGQTREAWHHARTASGSLAWLCNGAVLLLFFLTPVLWVRFGDTERVLTAVALPFLLLHGLGSLALWRCHGRLRPGRRGERSERVLAAALFPPSLWRTPQELVHDALVAFHPVAVASLSLEGESLELFVRRALTAATQPRQHTEAATLAALEATQIRALARELGLDVEQPRRRQDPAGERYCPLCHEDFRPGFETCSDCRIGTVAYGDADPTAA